MSAILRNNAVTYNPNALGHATLSGGGGDGRSAGPLRAAPARVKAKARYSHDPAAELMPAAEFLGAEPDFSAVLEDFQDSPFNPERRRVLGRLMGVFAMDYQSVRSQERAFLRRLLLARNAREGYVANRALHLVRAQHAVRRTLALGVAEARWEEGPIRGYLGAVQARVAATTFALLGPQGREEVWNLLTLAGHRDGRVGPGADPVIERALILKALGARRHRLGPWSKEGVGALEEVTEFAHEIRGSWRDTLAARTTLYPGDPNRCAPGLAKRSGAALAVYLAKGELDPVFAWREHGGAREVAPENVQAREDIYAALPDLDRSPLLDRPRAHQALAEARAQGEQGAGPLTTEEIEALSDYMVGAQMYESKTQAFERAYRVLLTQGFDVIPRKHLEAIRQDAQGIYRFDAAQGFGLLLSRYTGAMYVRRLFSDQMTAGLDPTAQIEASLRQGLVVPVVVRELRLPVMRAWTAQSAREADDTRLITLWRAPSDEQQELTAKSLLATKLPPPFGRQARAEMFLAPAALDLLAPPFGLAFPELGIQDRL